MQKWTFINLECAIDLGDDMDDKGDIDFKGVMPNKHLMSERLLKTCKQCYNVKKAHDDRDW